MNRLSILGMLALGATLAGCGTGMSSGDDGAELENARVGTSTGGSTSYDGNYSASGGTTSGAIVAEPGDTSSHAGGAANEGDNYDPVGTNPFVIVEHDPLSTFAADVDTASYDIFRRDVQNYGILPQPDSVRLEEYVNYFRYDYPAPAETAEHPFTIDLAATRDLVSETTVMRVGIQGELPPSFEKKPANLVYLVDVSGSMASSDKLPLAQYLLKSSLGVLDATDTVSIVTYASDVGVRLEPTPVSNAATIESAIDGLSSAGSTSGAAGIDLAYEQAQAGFIEGGINHVVLCTDGDFNVGPYSTDELVSLIEEKRKTGITLTVLGFGAGNLNDDMMEAVSNAGNGIYGVISSQDQADNYVENRLLSTLVHIAKDMKLQVEFNPDLVYAYRLLGYENRAIADEDFRDDIVDAGEIGAGHQVTALYQLVLTGGTIPSPEGALPVDDGDAYTGTREVAAEDMVLVKIRYKEPDATETDPAYEVATSMTLDDAAASFAESGQDLRWAMSIAAFAEILKQSPFGDVAALPTIQDVVDAQASRDADRAEFKTLFDQARLLLGH